MCVVNAVRDTVNICKSDVNFHALSFGPERGSLAAGGKYTVAGGCGALSCAVPPLGASLICAYSHTDTGWQTHAAGQRPSLRPLRRLIEAVAVAGPPMHTSTKRSVALVVVVASRAEKRQGRSSPQCHSRPSRSEILTGGRLAHNGRRSSNSKASPLMAHRHSQATNKIFS